MNSLKPLFIVLFAIFSCFTLSHSQIFVSPTGNNSNNGTSWDNAFIDINTAISSASPGDEVWVKTGTYKPSDLDRNASFYLKSGVKLFGGFAGTETSVNERLKTDFDGNGTIEAWEFSNPTILSGNINNQAGAEDNTKHIVIIPEGASSSTSINGFTIADGYNDESFTLTETGSKYYASGIIATIGSVENCIVQNCKNIRTTNTFERGVYGGGIFAGSSSIIKNCSITSCSAEGDLSSGGGIYLVNAHLESSIVSNCSVNGESNQSIYGGGIYAENSIVKDSEIGSCHSSIAFKSNGGGIYNNNSININCKIYNCAAEGPTSEGGGVFNINSSVSQTAIYNCKSNYSGGGTASVSSSLTNCLIYNNSANKIGGGASLNESYILNCNVANNTCSANEIGTSGGGLYAESNTAIYNTVIWGNTLGNDGSTPQLSISSGAEANYCAIQERTTSDANINLAAENTGTNENISYVRFINPTNFTGITQGDPNNETSLSTANWDIEKTSSLIEKGDNNSFTESNAPGGGMDLNGNGNITDIVTDFKDSNGEFRLFNAKVDIGAYESIFIDLQLPAVPTIAYGTSLGDINLTGGSAIDNRDDSSIVGSFTFVESSTLPPIVSPNLKYKIVYRSSDTNKYPDKFDELEVIVSPKEITVSNITANDKEYDGNDIATYTGTPSLTGIVGTDNVSLEQSSVGANFNDKLVGNEKEVSFYGFTLVGDDKGNYTLNTPTSKANILAKNITTNTLTAEDKQYDKNTTATYIETPILIGTINGDNVTLNNGIANFSDANIGDGKTVTFSGFTITGDDAINYSLTQANNSYANITPVVLKITGISVENKIYDGNSTASIKGTPVLSGILSGDDVSLNTSGIVATYNDKNVAANKNVSLSSITLNGVDKSNYTLDNPGDFTANITPQQLTIVGLGINNKIYDGTNTATLTGIATLQGAIESDIVSISTITPSANFMDSNAGVQKEINLDIIELLGNDKDNYRLIQPVLTATVSPIDIAIKADSKDITFGDKIPDFTYIITSGTVLNGDNFSGLLNADTNEDAGTYSITQNTLTLGNNYSISYTEGKLTINKAENVIVYSSEENVLFEPNKTITLKATSSAGEVVVFKSSDNNIASIEGDLLSIKSYGNININASQSGNKNYKAATSVTKPLFIDLEVNIQKKGSNMLLVDNIQEQFNSYQWFNNGLAITDGNKQFYHSRDGLSGEYYCEATTIKGDKFRSENVDITSTKSVSIYPSPAKAGQNIKLEVSGQDTDNNTPITINIFDVTGKLIKQIHNANNIENFLLDVKGIYIVKTEGGIQSTKKIIIK